MRHTWTEPTNQLVTIETNQERTEVINRLGELKHEHDRETDQLMKTKQETHELNWNRYIVSNIDRFGLQMKPMQSGVKTCCVACTH